MQFDFKKISPYKERLKLFVDSDVVSRVEKVKASVLSPKAKDCQRQLNEATSVWAIDRNRFLILFSEVNKEGLQKATVWGMKTPGNYLRVKTVWVTCQNNIFEAVALFLIQYFELFILTATYSSDTRMLIDIEDKLKEALRYTPVHLKQKIKLLKAWVDIMPRFNAMLADLDSQIKKGEEQRPNFNQEIYSKDIWVSRKHDSPVELDKRAEAIVDALDLSKPTSLNLIMAVVAYDRAAMLHESRCKTESDLHNREMRIIQCCSILLGNSSLLDLKDPFSLKRLNSLALIADYARATKFEKLEKALGKTLKINSERALRRKLPISIDQLELLVNTRRFNKRLPKELSDQIKEILNHAVHTINGFWNIMPEISSIEDRMRKLWIQCMSLRLYGYDPNESYTKKALCNEMPSMLSNPDARSLLEYAMICHDSDFDSVMIDNFDSIINDLIAKTSDNIELLKLHTARLLYKASAHELIPESDLKAIGDNPEMMVENSHSESKLIAYDMPPEKIKEWMGHFEHLRSLKSQGVSIKDFCLVKGLPIEEFSRFYEETLEEFRYLERQPLIQKLTELPVSEQTEFSSLINRHLKSVSNVCESFSILCGEKIEVNDFFSYEPKLIEKIRSTMENLDSIRKIHPVETSNFIRNYEEMVNLERSIQEFSQKYSLADIPLVP